MVRTCHYHRLEFSHSRPYLTAVTQFERILAVSLARSGVRGEGVKLAAVDQSLTVQYKVVTNGTVSELSLSENSYVILESDLQQPGPITWCFGWFDPLYT